MVEQARLALPQSDVKQIEFTQGSAEGLPILSNASVDLVIAGLLSPITE
jgi:ubiquinone/menaquinone biosynthesis C-methylase UbiE